MFHIGDIVKVVKGRKIPIGTVAKVIDIREEEYGGAYRDAQGVSHAMSGYHNYTVYLYLDCGSRTADTNCVMASADEIDAYNDAQSNKSQKVGTVGDKITFTGTAQKIGGFEGDKGYINKYLFTDVDGNLITGFSAEDFDSNQNEYSGEVDSYEFDRLGNNITKIRKIALGKDTSTELFKKKIAQQNAVYEYDGKIGQKISFSGTFKYNGFSNDFCQGFDLDDGKHVYVFYQSYQYPVFYGDSITGNFSATVKDYREYNNKKYTIVKGLHII